MEDDLKLNFKQLQLYKKLKKILGDLLTDEVVKDLFKKNPDLTQDDYSRVLSSVKKHRVKSRFGKW